MISLCFSSLNSHKVIDWWLEVAFAEAQKSHPLRFVVRVSGDVIQCLLKSTTADRACRLGDVFDKF